MSKRISRQVIQVFQKQLLLPLHIQQHPLDFVEIKDLQDLRVKLVKFLDLLDLPDLLDL
jgi:hypothetical protein